ncbi:phage terminase small subunit [Thermomonas sp.]|uniref:phage terminase small subunit n=1 Tax=Thermomonas sp. TaxID=1971895 RepID=UPI0035B23830
MEPNPPAFFGTMPSSGGGIHANAYELQLIALADAKRALKQVQSVERKADVKRRVLPQFQDWIAGVLEAGKPGQDDVLMTCMVWQIDVGDFDAALKSAAHALAHGLTLPDQYKRDVATLVAEEIAEQSLTALVSGRQVGQPGQPRQDHVRS